MEQEYIIQISEMAKTFHSYLNHGFVTFFGLSKLLIAKILRSLRETTWSQKSKWSLAAVIVLNFDFFLIKGETPECSPTLTFKRWHV